MAEKINRPGFKREAFPNRPAMFPNKPAPFIKEAFPKTPAPVTKAAKTKVKAKAKAVKPVKAVSKSGVTAPKGARFELWAYDEYNQGSIVASSGDLGQIVSKAKKYVSEMNVENALAGSEKEKSWEGYFPQVFKGKVPDNDTLYAGNKKNGSHHVWVKGDKWEMKPMDKGTKIKFYLGELNRGEDWYLADYKGNDISSLTDQSLDRKTILFIKVANA